MSNPDTWMPLYVSRYLGDTGHLTVAEHGAYLLLLMQYWVRGPLPDDDVKLAKMARTDIKAWRKGIGGTIREFFTVRDGVLHQKRADVELAKAGEIIEKKRAAANTRWGGGKAPPPGTPNGESQDRSAHADAMHVHSISTADGEHQDSTSTPDEEHQQSVSTPDAMQTQCPLPVPVQRKKESLSFSSSFKEERPRAYAPAREAEPSVPAVWAARQKSAAEVASFPAAIAAAIAEIERGLKVVPTPRGPDRWEQLEALGEGQRTRVKPQDPIRTPAEQYAALLGISVAEAEARLPQSEVA